MKFYGTKEETYVELNDGSALCIQSPDLLARNGEPAKVKNIPAQAVPVDIDPIEFGLCVECFNHNEFIYSEPKSELCYACANN